MAYVVKIDILTGQDEKVFYSEDEFSLHFIDKLCSFSKLMQFLKTYAVNYKSIAYCLTKLYENSHFSNQEINEGDNL